MVCAVIFNGLLAYGFAVLKPKGYIKFAFGLVMWSLLIPVDNEYCCSIPQYQHGRTVQKLCAIMAGIWSECVLCSFIQGIFEEIPTELLEACKVRWCGCADCFYKDYASVVKPIIMVVIIFSLTAAWSDFLLPYLVLNGSGKETVMVKLFAFKDTPTDAVSVLRATLFAIIPPTILFAIFQKQITDGATAGAVKG